MPVSDWSTDPNGNLTISGINIAEGCPAGNLNQMGREIMAGVRELSDNLPETDSFAPKSGAVFSGTQPTFAQRGAFLHHNSSSNASGRVYLLPDGSADPEGGVNGDIAVFYTP